MIGESLKRFRKNKGLTQKQLADKIGVSEITVRRYEKNNNIPNIAIIDKFAAALEVSVNELLYKDDEIIEMTTGEKIKYYRKNLNLTQQELANLSDISLRALSNYEKDFRKPSLETAIKISRVLKISPKDLDSNAIMLEEIKNNDISSFNFIGESIKKIRIKNNLTMIELSKKCEISQSYISDLENGKIKNPSVVKIEKIAEVLGATTNELIGCEYRKTNNLAKLQRYYEQKKWEYENIECEHNIGNEGVLKGLEIAINIMVES